MKRIDLHIHTIPAPNGKDAGFTFDIANFQHFTSELQLDAIAITNHNLFNQEQFQTINDALTDTVVFPGIEIDYEDGHLLLISENQELDDFAAKCASIEH